MGVRFYENGQKMMEGPSKDDLSEGFHRIWDKSGKIIWEGDFKMGEVIDDEGFPYSLLDDYFILNNEEGSVKN